MKDQKRTPEEQQLRMIKIQTVMIAAILVLVLVFVLVMVTKVSDVVAIVQQIDPEQINGAVASLRAAADRLASVDMDSLNSGIRGLSDAADELSTLDFEKLAGFMDSLETMGKQMDAVSNLFKGLSLIEFSKLIAP